MAGDERVAEAVGVDAAGEAVVHVGADPGEEARVLRGELAQVEAPGAADLAVAAADREAELDHAARTPW